MWQLKFKYANHECGLKCVHVFNVIWVPTNVIMLVALSIHFIHIYHSLLSDFSNRLNNRVRRTLSRPTEWMRSRLFEFSLFRLILVTFCWVTYLKSRLRFRWCVDIRVRFVSPDPQLPLLLFCELDVDRPWTDGNGLLIPLRLRRL